MRKIKKYIKSADKPIGICDSGVGGVTIVKEIQKILPNESLIYFGDVARAPYGSKSEKRIVEFATQDVSFLLQKNVKFVMVACNTMSAIALRVLRHKFDIPILGVIEAGAKAAAKKTKRGIIGVIGTEATIRSGIYRKEIQKSNSQIEVEGKACPLLVPLVEEGWLDTEVTTMIIKEYLRPLMQKQIDVLLLGCTHYPLLKRQICRILGEEVTVVDPAEEVALELKSELSTLGLMTSSTHAPKYDFFVSDSPERFDELARLFLNNQQVRARETEISILEEG